MPRHISIKTITAFAVMSFLLLVALPGTAQSKPVVEVGSWSMTLQEIDRQVAPKLFELKQDIYRARANKIRELMFDRLITNEAKARGMSESKLLDSEINGRVKPVTSHQVDTFIRENKSRLPDGGKGMESQIRDHLKKERIMELSRALMKNLMAKYKAKISLRAPTPPRMKVTGPDDLAKGSASAPVTIVEFSDFECGYCRKVQSTLDRVMSHYGNKVRLVFRHYPMPFHKKAPKASEGAQCAADQGKFWPFHDALFADPLNMRVSNMKRLASKLGLDTGKFNSCLSSGRHASRIANDLKAGEKLGVSGTPTFYINGIQLTGAAQFNRFQELIDAELAK